jgi:hypothetical protein
MRTVFTDSKMEAAFSNDGFAVMPVLGSGQVKDLADIYEMTVASRSGRSFTHTHFLDVTERRRIHLEVVNRFGNLLLHHLNDYEAVYGFFLAKKGGKEGVVRVHQDMTLVDESRFRGLTAWCALSDTSVENGCFHIVRKSHLFSNNVRGADDLIMPYEAIKDEIETRYSDPVELKAGEVIFFDHRLWHCSPMNNTSRERIAVACVFIPCEAEMCHYTRTGTGSITKFTVPRDFPLAYEIGAHLPDGCKVAETDVLQAPDIDLATFDRAFNKINGKHDLVKAKAERMWNRLKSIRQ